ncbi:MAG: MarR family transcriptional regulator/GNAT family N-acetyltransferase [Flavobacteriaceae bacterium]|nr:MarR family transcriptional regulator/GNAT family N-acetyltransferase [Flavobacteriaceae bacterium]
MDSLKVLGELSLGSRLKRLSDMCMKAIHDAYKHYDIDFDPFLFPAFYNIAFNKTITNTELMELLQTSQPAVTQTINKLLKKELVTVGVDSNDGRKKNVQLSYKGKSQLVKMQPIWRAMDEAVKEFTTQPANTLLDHIEVFESAIKSGEFLNTILTNMENQSLITIVDFQEEYSQEFYDLNIEWLETYFYVEDFDREVLSNPDKYILGPGGHIFFAVENGKAIGTVALMKSEENTYELTKMAVHPSMRGRKVGQQLMQYCIDFAREQSFDKLFLYSNTLLENAIYIYRKYGFVEIPVEDNSPYNRSNIKMELKL